MLSNEKWFGASPSFYPETIDQSLRFEDDDTARLSKTFGSGGDRKTWTWSAWIKRGTIGINGTLFHTFGVTGFGVEGFIAFSSNDTLQFFNHDGSSSYYRLITNRVFRDTSNWFHLCVVSDVTNSTQSERYRMYVNGVRETSFSTESQPPNTTFQGQINTTYSHYIGGRTNNTTMFDGYLAEVNFLDGTAITDTNGILDEFIEIKNGVCIPKEISGLSYGTTGFRLEFADSSSLGDDTSGNTNDFTSSGVASHDVCTDTPTNNFATLNNIGNDSGITHRQGNLQPSISANTSNRVEGTFAVSSGKWYWEVRVQTYTSAPTCMIGIKDLSIAGHEDDNWNTASVYSYYGNNGNKYNSGSSSSYGATFTTGDIIGVALDLDAGTLTFYKNGSSQGTAYSGLTGEYTLCLGTGLYYWVANVNFGQEGSFSGLETAQGNADDNGIGNFYYSPPTGHLALCSSNLPDTTLSPNQSEQADDYFGAITYSGSSSNLTITTNFQADWLWFKERTNNGIQHQLFDSSRLHSTSSAKFGRRIELPTIVAEADSTAIVSQSGNDITLLAGVSTVNSSSFSRQYVMWHWKANGGTTSSNTDGTITSTVQASTDAGFSIVTYTGTGTNTDTVGHGLGAKPKMVIVKSRSESQNYHVYHEELDATAPHNYTVFLNADNARATSSSTYWGGTAPTTTVMGVGSDNSSNKIGQTFVMYCFAEVEGHSKFGQYTGNSSADGTYVHLGFRPAFIMVKKFSGADDWVIHDNARSPFNVVNGLLTANSTDDEFPDDSCDFLSQGFKWRLNSGARNTSGQTYLYMAFSDGQTAKFSNAR